MPDSPLDYDFREHNRRNMLKAVALTQQDHGAYLAIYEAIRFSLLEAVEDLIKSGVDVNERSAVGPYMNFAGMTPLMACYSKKMGELLVKYGADVTARDSEGRTPLIWFFHTNVYNKSVARAYLKWLLSVGADPNDFSRAGDSARELALEMYGFDLDELYREAQAKMNPKPKRGKAAEQ